MNTENLFLNVENFSQMVLWECEIKGQLSDGYWEGSLPSNHWEQPCGATARLIFGGKFELGTVNWSAKLRYKFNDPELKEAVGKRMINFVKFYSTFPHVSFKDRWNFECNDSILELADRIQEDFNETKELYWKDKAQRLINSLEVCNIEELKQKLMIVNSFEYTETDLTKDLISLSKIVSRRAAS